MDKKAFTLIELLVVIAVVGILVLLAAPRFTGYTQKAERTRIQHDTKMMEEEVGAVLINGDDEFNEWENNSKDYLNQLAQDNELFEKEGYATELEPTDGNYKIIPEKYKGKINTKLKGTFYANSGGKVYYEHGKGPGYSDEEIDDLVYRHKYIPVATAEELNNVRNATVETYGKGTKWEGKYLGGLDKHYVQVLNVDLSEYSKEEKGWSPIGASVNYTSSFRGTYDGGNYVITNLKVKGEGKIRQGLFGRTYEATIRNVGLIDNKVTGEWYVGGLVGEAGSTDISNSYATGDVTGSLESGTGGIGGLVGTAGTGTNSNKNTTISNSYATGSVKGRHSVGGLVGSASDNTMISNSYAEGSVTSKGSKINSVMAGGLVGYISTGTTISNSYATGPVTGTVTGAGTGGTGGLVGAFYKFYDPVTIINSYATGLVTAGEGTGKNEVGGLVGQVYKDNDNITISNAYWNKETTGKTSSHGGGIGLATEQMKNQATYPDGDSGWDFTNIWEITPGNYPTLR